MAVVKISALTEITAPATTDIMPIVSGGATKKVTLVNLWKAIGGSAAVASLTVGLQAGASGSIVVNNTATTKPFELSNGAWYSTPVPYFRPTEDRAIALDIMPKGATPLDTWLDVCSTDVVADNNNFETIKLCKQANGAAYLSCTKAGSGTVRDLGLQTGGGNVGIGTAAPAISVAGGGHLHLTGKVIRLAGTNTPAAANATGNAGEICWDADYVYVCVGENTWKRAALSTWP